MCHEYVREERPVHQVVQVCFLGWEWLSSKSDREVGIKCLSAHMFQFTFNESEPRKFVVKGPLNIGWILFGRWQTLLDLDGVS